LGATWISEKDGLLLVSHVGQLISCKGSSLGSNGIWRCDGLKNKLVNDDLTLPIMEGRRLKAGIATWIEGNLYAAFVDATSPSIIAVFVFENDSGWMLFGEVPFNGDERLQISFSHGTDNTPFGLLISTSARTLRYIFGDGSFKLVGLAPKSGKMPGGGYREWQAACDLVERKSIAHLSLLQSESPSALPTGLPKPELSISLYNMYEPFLSVASNNDAEGIENVGNLDDQRDFL